MTLDEINMELKAISYGIYKNNVDMMYEDMVNEMCAGFEMLEYAARSYDADAVSYGMK